MDWLRFFMISCLVFIIGMFVGMSFDTDMYKRDYKQCITELPRNKDCKAISVTFKVVDTKN